jgi:hypothetical protein
MRGSGEQLRSAPGGEAGSLLPGPAAVGGGGGAARVGTIGFGLRPCCCCLQRRSAEPGPLRYLHILVQLYSCIQNTAYEL